MGVARYRGAREFSSGRREEGDVIRKLSVVLALAVAGGDADAQAPKGGTPRLFSSDEIISTLPGRWEYPVPEGVGEEASVRCDKFAERIWFERDDKGELIYHSQYEEPGSERSVSRVGVSRFPFPERPTIRLQYQGETRLDDKGKPVAWEVIMVERDTFYWHRVDWPPGATTPPVRRCREDVSS
jgi:hypothetical protein